MQSRAGWIVAAIAAAVLGAGVAAVTSGGDGGGGPAIKAAGQPTGKLELIANSAEVASEAGTARFELDMTIDGGAEGSTGIGGSGELRFDPPGARMTMDMGGIPGMGSGTFEMILDGSTMYMKPPEGLPEPPPTPWVSVNLEQVAGSNAFTEFGASDPTQMLDFLRGASSGVRAVGREDVRGVSTTHYQAEVDIEKAVAEEPSVAQAFEQYKLMGAPTVFPVEVWIDDQGLPHKMVMTMDLSGVPGAPAGAGVSFTIELFDYGADVSIEPPPPGQVTDMTDMA